MALSPRQCVEAFHLVFLRALAAKGEDKRLIVLKGGCNLRFYFGSVRYSEDIDLDVEHLRRETLRSKVERLLRSPLVTAPLKAQRIELTEVTAPKQTDTTQRWKVGLSGPGTPVALRTKVEFSRRSAGDIAAFEAVDPEVLRPYALTPFLASHYPTHVAITQKIEALSGRTVPQARDVFDLNVLFARPEAAALALGRTHRLLLDGAIAQAMDISWDAYRSQVVAYLDPTQAALYQGRSSWDAMQDAVVTRLDGLR